MNDYITIKEQFSTIYDNYAEELLSFVFFKVNDKDLTEDIVADTFAKLWHKMADGEVLRNARALLYLMARSLIVDYYRKKSIRHDIPLEDVVDTLIAEGSLVFDIDTKAGYDEVMRVMYLIKPQYTDILLLHYVQELSIHEIADILSETENNIRVRLHRAVQSIRKKLKYEH